MSDPTFTYLLLYAAPPELIVCGAYTSLDRAVRAFCESSPDKQELDDYTIYEVPLDADACYYLEHSPWGPVERVGVELAEGKAVVPVYRYAAGMFEDRLDA